MADHETDEPAGLWESVYTHLSKNEHKKDRHLLWLWTRHIGTAAAAIAIFTTIGLLAPKEKEEDIRQLVITDTEYANTVHIPHITSYSEAVTQTNISKTPIQTVAETAIQWQVSPQEETQPQSPLQPEQSQQPQQKEQPEQKKQKPPYPWEREYFIQAPKQKRHTKRFSFGIYTSGGIKYTLYGKTMEGNTVGASLNGSEWKDDPMLGIHFLNRGKEIESHIHHKQPIREGISFIYQLNDRISFESGVTYTILLSDIKKGSENHYYTGKQSLHYIGIPLHIKYRTFSWKQLDLYASSGILMENRLSGKIEKKYVINNTIYETEKENISSKPFQLSANIGIGLQYRLVSIIGIYAEPGLSYYFDDHSDIQTIYKEKPFNFNFNIGLRFTWGK